MEPDKSAITDKMFAVHAKYFSPIAFDEVEHIPNEFKTFESDITLQEGCLLISYNFFEKYYTELLKILSNEQVSHNLKSVAADLVLCMNGQNEKAWHFKREHLKDLNIQREMKFNSSICLKFKKSSICYDFRLQLINNHLASQKPQLILKSEHNEFISKILSRFHRNAFCWMYRVKLYQYLASLPTSEGLFKLESELLKEYCEKNIHDHSAFWHLFNHIRNNINQEAESNWINQLIDFYQAAYCPSEQGAKLLVLHIFRNWVSKSFQLKS